MIRLNERTVIVYAYGEYERIELARFRSEEEAREAIMNDLEWDDGDIIEDWKIVIFDEVSGLSKVVDPRDYVPSEYLDDSFDECGFDPYEGCYTYDC